MRVTYVIPDDGLYWNNTMQRCIVPANAINRTGRHSAVFLNSSDFAAHSQKSRTTCEQSNVIVIYRNLFGDTLKRIQHWKARGKTVIADFDEAYQLIQAGDPDYSFWNEGIVSDSKMAPLSPAPIIQFKWGLQLVNGATAASIRLADDWKSYTRICTLPTYIDLERYAGIRAESHKDIILGWRGVASQLKSLRKSGALEALKEICKTYSQVKVMLCCDDLAGIHNLGLPEDQTIIKSCIEDENPLASLAYIDIGLAPLSGDFEQRKSWVSLLEYMIMRIPWVASRSSAYHELRPYGWLVENKSGAWQRILVDMIDHLTDYKLETAQSAYLFGLAQSIDENVIHILDTYAKIGDGTQEWEENSHPVQPLPYPQDDIFEEEEGYDPP